MRKKYKKYVKCGGKSMKYEGNNQKMGKKYEIWGNNQKCKRFHFKKS